MNAQEHMRQAIDLIKEKIEEEKPSRAKLRADPDADVLDGVACLHYALGVLEATMENMERDERARRIYEKAMADAGPEAA